ncbi:Uncharacterized protein PECH_004762 [Penicillium ucsense]|uniref:Uncharacterized protein n=1 Tax=Penicillium ucsense TaxID=2839758 RepID=A0A8J8WLW8_9EURO|nr:Uncharacterized protein PECM_007602 [Penicillium ucsense]KAF7739286.1 Uncharacterized protein PECH_004762 [Penicillium ucsense]
MVNLSTVQASNASLPKTLFPSDGPVGVFVGATNGIGRASLLAFAKYTQQPRLYFIGRSQTAADEVLGQLKDVNPGGQYEFIKADASLLRNVDQICQSIQAKETRLDILFQSQGTLDFSSETSEKLPLIMALGYYSKMRFIANLLPLLQRSSTPRVVVVLAGTKEGPVNPNDIPGKKVKPWQARGHLCSMMTLTMERFAQSAPGVSFVHSYPGFVRTSLDQSIKGVTGVIMRSIFPIVNMFATRNWISLEETGDRHVFLSTAPRYAAKERSAGLSSEGGRVDGPQAVVASNGEIGAGVYTVDEYCESGDASVQQVLQKLRENRTDQKIWEHLNDVFKRATGKSSIH